MARTIRAHRTCVLVAILLTIAAPLYVSADTYRWTDRDGIVHFTESPPPPGRAVQVKRIGDAPDDTPPAITAPSWKPGNSYQGDKPSRLIGLEKVGFRIENPYERPLAIGSSCGRSLTSHDASRWGENISWSSGFHGRLEQLGYQTPGSATLSFSNEPPKALELSVIGVITSLQVEGCTVVRKLRVEWRMFDNLLRRVVYETTTLGSDELGTSTDPRKSMLEAFVSAANQLFAERGFRTLMIPQDIPPADAMASLDAASSFDAASAGMDPLMIALRYADRSSAFRDQVEAIKQASVTVRTTSGHGSGFLVSDTGHVLTNDHVVRGSNRVLVLIGNREIEATVFRSNAVRDVALLQLSTLPGVPSLQLSNERPVEGDTLYVVGTPLDERLHHTVTRGILSAVRELDNLHYYQTDAAVNPGNSGGPVFDTYGRVVGITVAGAFSRDGGSLGINLLIPMDEALQALQIESR